MAPRAKVAVGVGEGGTRRATVMLRQPYNNIRRPNCHADETAVLVTDDSTLQKIAASLDYPSLVLEILHSIEQDSTTGRLSVDSVARGREVRSSSVND